MLTWSREIVEDRSPFVADGVRMARGKLGIWRVAFAATGPGRYACTLALTRPGPTSELVRVIRDLTPEGRRQAAETLYALADASEAKGRCDPDDGQREDGADEGAGQDQPRLAATQAVDHGGQLRAG